VFNPFDQPDRLGPRGIRDAPQLREGLREAAERVTDVVDIAIEQHTRIEALFYEIEAAVGRRRRALLGELVRLSSEHEAAEEDTIHRLARDWIPGGFDVIRDLMAEERVAQQMLRGLTNTGVDAPDFDDSLITVRDAFMSHAGHEERYEFPRLRKLVPAELLRELAPTMRPSAQMNPQATRDGRRP
jgi:hypothetical protein